MAKLEELLGWCAELRINAVTAWVLSTENLRRPAEELDPYFDVLEELFARLPGLSARLGFSLAVSGSLDLLPARLALAAKQAVARAGDGGNLHVNIALCYGGRQEIVDACRALVGDLAAEGVSRASCQRPLTPRASPGTYMPPTCRTPTWSSGPAAKAGCRGSCCGNPPTRNLPSWTPIGPLSGASTCSRALRDYARRQRRFGTSRSGGVSLWTVTTPRSAAAGGAGAASTGLCR